MLLGQRATTTIDVGKYSGVTALVDQIVGEPLYVEVGSRVRALGDGQADTAGLTALYELYLVAARPTWNITFPSGPVPPTTAGMLRLPVALGVHLIQLWLRTYQPDDEPETEDVEGEELADDDEGAGADAEAGEQPEPTGG